MKSKHSFLAEFLNDLNKFNELKSQNKETKKKKTNVYDKTSEFYNDLLEICFDENNDLTVAKRKKIEHKYDPANLLLETYNYDPWFENEESSNTARQSDKEESVDLSHIPPPEGGEEVKEGKGIKILTQYKLLSKFPILFQYEISQILYCLYQHS